MSSPQESELFERIFNAFNRIETVISQQSAPPVTDNSERIQFLEAENARLRTAAENALSGIDQLLAQYEGGVV